MVFLKLLPCSASDVTANQVHPSCQQPSSPPHKSPTKFVIASVARGLDVLGGGRQQTKRETDGLHLHGPAQVHRTPEAGALASPTKTETYWLGLQFYKTKNTRFEMPAPLAA